MELVLLIPYWVEYSLPLHVDLVLQCVGAEAQQVIPTGGYKVCKLGNLPR